MIMQFIDTISDIGTIVVAITLINQMRKDIATRKEVLRVTRQHRSDVDMAQLESLIVPNLLDGNPMCRSCEYFQALNQVTADRYSEPSWFRRVVLRQKRTLIQQGAERIALHCALRNEQLLSQYQSCDQHQPASPQSNVARIPDGMF